MVVYPDMSCPKCGSIYWDMKENGFDYQCLKCNFLHKGYAVDSKTVAKILQHGTGIDTDENERE